MHRLFLLWMAVGVMAHPILCTDVLTVPARGAVDREAVARIAQVCRDLQLGRHVNNSDGSVMRCFDATLGFPGEGPTGDGDTSATIVVRSPLLGNKKRPRPQNGGGPSVARGEWDKDVFTVAPCGGNSNNVTIGRVNTRTEYIIPKQRTSKALKYLHPNSLASLCSPLVHTNCSCLSGKTRCTTKLTYGELERERVAYFGATGEQGATTFMANRLIPHNHHVINRDPGARAVICYYLGTQPVCRSFFMQLYGVSKDKKHLGGRHGRDVVSRRWPW